MITTHYSIISLVFALLLTAVGQLLFRMSFVYNKKGYLAASLSTFLAVPFFSYLSLLNLTLSLVYMSTALTHVLVLVFSYIFLNERIPDTQYLPISLIIIGIIVFNL